MSTLPNGNKNSQLNRVIYVMTKRNQFMTLTEIHRMIKHQIGEYDTEAAISARLREISPAKHGLVKQIKVTKNELTKKRCWHYRLERWNNDC